MITRLFIILSIILSAASIQASQIKIKKDNSSNKSLIYSKHAQDRMKQRDRDAKNVEAALQASIPYQSKCNKNRTVHIDSKSGTKVVTEKNRVVTVIAKKPKFQTPWNPKNDENYKADTRLLQQYKGKNYARQIEDNHF